MKTALITGGSRGIGAACVRQFAREGYRVFFLYEKSDGAAKALETETAATAIRADVAERAQVFAAFAQAGPIDALVCCAGIAQLKLFQDITEEEWRRMIDVNLSGAFFAAQAALPSMISRKAGSIVFLSSIWGLTGASCETHYSASKAGLIGLARALAKEVGPSGVRVNCVAPGAIDTDMNRGLSSEDVQTLVDETPLGRLGTPDDAAQAALFLASDAASFITGQVLSPNGGYVI